MEDLQDNIYQRDIIEFVAVAKEFAIFIETADKFPKPEFIEKLHKVLPFLYFKATLLPDLENTYDELIEKYVTETMYNDVLDNLAMKMGQHDAYQEVFNEDFQYSESPIAASISEDLADVYQDVKDFTMLYRVGTEEIMNDAVWECRNNFKLYWGQKLVNCMRAVHQLYYSGENLTDEENEAPGQQQEEQEDIDTSDWIISKMQNNHKKP